MNLKQTKNFIVSYELLGTNSHDELEQYLLDLNARQVHDTLWVIASDRTANFIGTHLQEKLRNDFAHLHVSEVVPPYFSRGSQGSLATLLSDLIPAQFAE